MHTNNGQIIVNRKKRNRLIFNIMKLLITGAIFYYIFYKYIQYNDFLSALKYVQPWMFIYLLIISLIFRYLNAYQIHYYFKQVFNSKLGTNFVFKVQLISSFYGLVLPGDLAGGLITWYMLSDKSGKKAASASVIIFLRLMSIITLIAFTAIGLVFEEKLIDINLRVYIIILAVLFLLMFIPFVSSKAATIMKQFSRAIIQITPAGNWRNKLIHLSNKLWDSVITCTNVDLGVILWTVCMSMLCHLFLILITYLLMIMVGINLPFQVSVWLLGAINLVQMLPISFAGLGVRDISIIYLLGKYYQVAPESSLILSTLFLAFNLIFILIGGMFVLMGGTVDRQKLLDYQQMN
ncbi:MAG: flippase-like domain-containing protein [Proteobacteria bacterium]|nr:flippase-like domain-containing protein [Pseudomonadota bacterium]